MTFKFILTGTDLGRGVTAGSAGLLLVVESTVSAASAESVRLGVTLTEGSGTLGLRREKLVIRHLYIGIKFDMWPCDNLHIQGMLKAGVYMAIKHRHALGRSVGASNNFASSPLCKCGHSEQWAMLIPSK
jgi:hypothetical protein